VTTDSRKGEAVLGLPRGSRSDRGVRRNVRTYTKYADAYDRVHPEIFNPAEQERLGAAVARAVEAIESGGTRALDFGCGTGNITRHLLALGQDVTAADVTPKFLRIVEDRFGVPTIHLADGDLAHIPDASFDIVGVYSVLHHIPDYLAAVEALVGKLKPGGVVFIDHEVNDNYWNPPAELEAFRHDNAEARTGDWWDPEHKRWQHNLRAAVTPSRHIARIERLRGGGSREGDIHIHADDHIEWDRVIATLETAGAVVVERMDYLMLHAGYDADIWSRYRDRCNDTTGVIARRTRSASPQPAR
jgi:SAM-dependent methyltransferase